MDASRAITMPGVTTLDQRQPATTGSVVTPSPLPAPRVPAATTQPRLVGVAGRGRTGEPLHDAIERQLELDPIGGEAAALDRLSASITYDPAKGLGQARIPGASLQVDPANSLGRMSREQVANLSTPDFLAASQSSLAAASGAGIEQGTQVLDNALAPDPITGKNVFDTRIESLQRRVDALREEARSNPLMAGALLAEAAAIAKEVLLTQREREKHELMRRLLFSLMCGVVPAQMIARMVELGMGGIVERAIRDTVGSGRGISKSMSQQLQGVGAAHDLSLHIAPPEQTFDAMAQADRKLADDGATLADGRRVDAHGRLVSGSGDLAGQGGSSAAAQPLATRS